jgi:hypothetical protein
MSARTRLGLHRGKTRRAIRARRAVQSRRSFSNKNVGFAAVTDRDVSSSRGLEKGRDHSRTTFTAELAEQNGLSLRGSASCALIVAWMTRDLSVAMRPRRCAIVVWILLDRDSLSEPSWIT